MNKLVFVAALLTTAAHADPLWQADATARFYNKHDGLAWEHLLGDHAPAPLGSVTVELTDTMVRVPIAGASDAYLKATGGSARYSAVQCETAGKTTPATRIAAMSLTTGKPSQAMDDAGAVLVACPGPADNVIFTVSHVYAKHTLTAYQPLPHPVYPASTDFKVNPTVVASFDGRNITLNGPYTGHRVNKVLNADHSVSAWIGGPDMQTETMISNVLKLPMPMTEAYLTVVIKLGTNWPDEGGKLPGLANSGLATNTGGGPKIFDPKGNLVHLPAGTPVPKGYWNCSNAGFGGRTVEKTGCKWTARTGFHHGSNLGTYFYAQTPHDVNGVMDFFPTVAPKGKFFAYVERVRVNTPALSDGVLSYWMMQPDGTFLPQINRTGIKFRSYDSKEALISEVWANVFCGGHDCGPSPWPRADATLQRMTVTLGLPDLTALRAELKGLNK